MNSTKLTLAAALLLAAGSVALLRADSEVGDRQQNQQARIEQGEKSGELTKGEAHKVEKEHKAIGKEIKADRAANGGKLTKSEKRDINRQQNKESRKIYRKKHNAKTAK